MPILIISHINSFVVLSDNMVSTVRLTPPPLAFQRPKFKLLQAPPPGEDNIRSLPDLVDFNEKLNPDHTFCFHIRQCDQSAEVIEITHRELKKAVEECSTRIRANIDGIRSPRVSDDGKIVKCLPVA